MKRHVFTILVLAALVWAGSFSLGGILEPPGPPGDPATQMKTLNEIEPRRLIDTLPYAITNPWANFSL